MERKIRTTIFEDDPETRSLLSLLVSRRGHEVQAFSTPSSSDLVSNVSHRCPPDGACTDILITDFMMPGMTGLELLRTLSRLGCRCSRQNMILMTANDSPEVLENARRLGCRVLAKPFRLKDLDLWLQECERRLNG